MRTKQNIGPQNPEGTWWKPRSAPLLSRLHPWVLTFTAPMGFLLLLCVIETVKVVRCHSQVHSKPLPHTSLLAHVLALVCWGNEMSELAF